MVGVVIVTATTAMESPQRGEKVSLLLLMHSDSSQSRKVYFQSRLITYQRCESLNHHKVNISRQPIVSRCE